MALVHQLLYQSDEFDVVPFAAYARQLTDSIVRAHSTKRRVIPRFELEEVLLDVDRAIPLGLILAELVTNALKHGLAERGGEVRVGLHPCEQEACVLVVEDDGPGFPALPERPVTLGMKLVAGLARQIGAELRYQAPGAARVEIHVANTGSSQ